jgi:hypothetical protein
MNNLHGKFHLELHLCWSGLALAVLKEKVEMFMFYSDLRTDSCKYFENTIFGVSAFIL